MHVAHETNNKEKIYYDQKLLTSAQWFVLLICLLILASVVIFAEYHQAHAADSVAVTELKPIQPIQGGRAPANQPAAGNTTDELATMPSIWPANGAVTSGFGWRSFPLGGGSEMHPGIDIASAVGTPVVATADGKVVQSGWSGGYGNMVQIDHGNGIVTIYGHNSRLAAYEGQTVKKGQVISYSGNTGASTGPHVHYEVRINGTAVDPIKYLVQY